MKKGFAQILILGLVTAVFVLGGTYFWKRMQKPPVQLNTPNIATTSLNPSATPKPDSGSVSSIDNTDIKSIDDSISYTLPQGWTKEYRNQDGSYIYLLSPNVHYADSGFIDKGAKIRISRYKNNPNKTLQEQIQDIPYVVDLLQRTARPSTPIKMGGNQGFNSYDCFGSCGDYYYFLNGNYVWLFFFDVPQCPIPTKACEETNIYTKDRDAFLSSIKFK